MSAYVFIFMKVSTMVAIDAEPTTLNNSAAYEKLFFMSDADGDGVGDTRDAYPLDPSRSVQVNEIPTLPLFGLLTLAGLLGLFGLRKLRQ